MRNYRAGVERDEAAKARRQVAQLQGVPATNGTALNTASKLVVIDGGKQATATLADIGAVIGGGGGGGVSTDEARKIAFLRL